MKSTMTKVALIWTSMVIAGLFFANLGYADLNVKDVVGMWVFDTEDDVIEDKSGNGNDGNIMGNLEFTDGVYGKALEFDGTATNYVDCGNAESLNMDLEITIAFWFKTDKEMPDMWADRQVIIGKHYLEYEVGIYPQGQIHTYTSDGAGGYDEGIMASMSEEILDADWELDQWYHMAWTLKEQTEVAYVNGIKIGEHTKPNEGTQGGDHSLELGRRQGGGLPLTGALDDLVILNAALDEEDIKKIYDVGVEWAFGLAAVSPEGNIATTWGEVKK